MFSSALAVIGGVLGAAVLLGAAYAAFRASDLRATVSDQKKRIDSLITEREELIRDLTEEKQERQLLDRRLEAAERQIEELQAIVSGRVDFSALETSLEHHHIEVTRRNDERHAEQMAALKDIKALLHAQRTGDQP